MSLFDTQGCSMLSWSSCLSFKDWIRHCLIGLANVAELAEEARPACLAVALPHSAARFRRFSRGPQGRSCRVAQKVLAQAFDALPIEALFEPPAESAAR